LKRQTLEKNKEKNKNSKSSKLLVFLQLGVAHHYEFLRAFGLPPALRTRKRIPLGFRLAYLPVLARYAAGPQRQQELESALHKQTLPR
jgi:hypothetical protein